MSVRTNATSASFGGKLLKLTHHASATKCDMNFNLYLPPQASTDPLSQVPLLIFLAGLTGTEGSGAEKGSFNRPASEHGIAVLYPDTSPRGLNIPGEDDDEDFGTGASFYVDATKPPWSENYRMATYVTQDLPDTVFRNFPQIDAERVSITGHSAGGHGALTLFLKNPSLYKSVSAFAPIANLSACPWGQKALAGYFGPEDRPRWAEHDATELVRKWDSGPLEILVDIGTADPFLSQNQLLPDNFTSAAAQAVGGNVNLRLRWQEGYDHSYYFVASFAEEHVKFAAKFLLG